MASAMKWFAPAVLASTVLSSPAVAKIMTIKLTGSVYYITPSMAEDFTFGEIATALLRYDTATPAEPWSSTVAFYPAASLGGYLRVGSYNVGFNDAGRMFVTDQEVASYGFLDRLIFDNFDPDAMPLNGRRVDAVAISFNDFSASIFSSLLLPDDPAVIKRFNDVRATIDWNPYIGAEHRIAVSFNSVSATVPEPATWALMIVGFGAVGGAMRRGRYRTSRAASL